MGTTYKEAIFCGDMAGKLTQFTNANGLTFADITTEDANGPVRIDSLAASTDDALSQAVLALKVTDGVTSIAMTNIPLNRAVKNEVTNKLVTFTFAATTITRSAGSWLVDGFKVGDYPNVVNNPDAASNILGVLPITALTDTVMTIATATMTARAAYYGTTAVAVPDSLAVTNLLAAVNMAPFVGVDSAGNKFLELPKGWKLQAALLAAPTGTKGVNIQACWGAYASAA